MKTSEQAMALIERSEQFVPHLYNCPANHCTIGFGHLVHKGPICGAPSELEFAQGIDRPRAIQLLEGDLDCAERAVERLVKVPLTQGQFDALVDFVFNLGEGHLTSSTLLRLLNMGQYDRIPDELQKWVFSGGVKLAGLVSRRQAEAELFRKG